jgi:hypothetical protein
MQQYRSIIKPGFHAFDKAAWQILLKLDVEDFYCKFSVISDFYPHEIKRINSSGHEAINELLLVA